MSEQRAFSFALQGPAFEPNASRGLRHGGETFARKWTTASASIGAKSSRFSTRVSSPWIDASVKPSGVIHSALEAHQGNWLFPRPWYFDEYGYDVAARMARGNAAGHGVATRGEQHATAGRLGATAMPATGLPWRESANAQERVASNSTAGAGAPLRVAQTLASLFDAPDVAEPGEPSPLAHASLLALLPVALRQQVAAIAGMAPSFEYAIAAERRAPAGESPVMLTANGAAAGAGSAASQARVTPGAAGAGSQSSASSGLAAGAASMDNSAEARALTLAHLAALGEQARAKLVETRSAQTSVTPPRTAVDASASELLRPSFSDGGAPPTRSTGATVALPDVDIVPSASGDLGRHARARGLADYHARLLAAQVAEPALGAPPEVRQMPAAVGASKGVDGIPPGALLEAVRMWQLVLARGGLAASEPVGEATADSLHQAAGGERGDFRALWRRDERGLRRTGRLPASGGAAWLGDAMAPKGWSRTPHALTHLAWVDGRLGESLAADRTLGQYWARGALALPAWSGDMAMLQVRERTAGEAQGALGETTPLMRPDGGTRMVRGAGLASRDLGSLDHMPDPLALPLDSAALASVSSASAAVDAGARRTARVDDSLPVDDDVFASLMAGRGREAVAPHETAMRVDTQSSNSARPGGEGAASSNRTFEAWVQAAAPGLTEISTGLDVRLSAAPPMRAAGLAGPTLLAPFDVRWMFPEKIVAALAAGAFGSMQPAFLPDEHEVQSLLATFVATLGHQPLDVAQYEASLATGARGLRSAAYGGEEDAPRATWRQVLVAAPQTGRADDARPQAREVAPRLDVWQDGGHGTVSTGRVGPLRGAPGAAGAAAEAWSTSHVLASHGMALEFVPPDVLRLAQQDGLSAGDAAWASQLALMGPDYTRAAAEWLDATLAQRFYQQHVGELAVQTRAPGLAYVTPWPSGTDERATALGGAEALRWRAATGDTLGQLAQRQDAVRGIASSDMAQPVGGIAPTGGSEFSNAQNYRTMGAWVKRLLAASDAGAASLPIDSLAMDYVHAGAGSDAARSPWSQSAQAGVRGPWLMPQHGAAPTASPSGARPEQAALELRAAAFLGGWLQPAAWAAATDTPASRASAQARGSDDGAFVPGFASAAAAHAQAVDPSDADLPGALAGSRVWLHQMMQGMEADAPLGALGFVIPAARTYALAQLLSAAGADGETSTRRAGLPHAAWAQALLAFPELVTRGPGDSRDAASPQAVQALAKSEVSRVWLDSSNAAGQGSSSTGWYGDEAAGRFDQAFPVNRHVGGPARGEYVELAQRSGAALAPMAGVPSSSQSSVAASARSPIAMPTVAAPGPGLSAETRAAVQQISANADMPAWFEQAAAKLFAEPKGGAQELSLEEMVLISTAPPAQLAASTRGEQVAPSVNPAPTSKAALGGEEADVDEMAREVFRSVMQLMAEQRARNGEP